MTPTTDNPSVNGAGNAPAVGEDRGRIKTILDLKKRPAAATAVHDDRPLHDVPRHPEDPPDGLPRGVGEASLLDPDQMRVNAVDVGITGQALPPVQFDPLVKDEYDGLLGIRVGAVEGPALEEAGRLAKIETTTDRDVAAITADGFAAADAAARRQTDVLPRLEQKAQQTAEDHEHALAERDELERHAMTNGAYWTETAAIDPTPVGGPLHLLAITPGRAKFAGAVEVIIGGLVLSAPVGQAISLDFPFGSLLVGMALSLMLFLLGWFGGKALAAVELPVRAVAAFFVVVALWIIWRSMVSMDALRVGENDEGKKILTAATLANIYIAALTSYAASIYEVFTRRRELIATMPTPVDLWREMRERLQGKVEETKAAMLKAAAELEAGHEFVDEQKTIAAGTDGRCRRREGEGVTAQTDLKTLNAVTAAHIDQEVANRDAAVTAALLAHAKTRAEEYPQFPTFATAAGGVATERVGGLSVFHKAAIACLLIGAVGGLLGYQLVLTLGAGAAAVLLLLGLTAWAQRLGTGKAAANGVPPMIAPPVSTAPGLQRARGWKLPPRSTKAKYGTAGNDPTQRH